MNTKKTILILMMLIGLIFNGFAQGIGISLNYNSAKFIMVENGEVSPTNSIEHFHSIKGFGFELNYDIELMENLYGETGISYQLKGHKIIVDDEGYEGKYDWTNKIKVNYFQIPIHVKYNFEIGDESYLFGFGGFDLGFAIGGKNIIDDGKETKENDIKFGSSESDDLKSSDLGLTFGAGLLFKNIEFRLGFSNGLNDIDPDKDDEINNRVFFAGIGYRIGN